MIRVVARRSASMATAEIEKKIAEEVGRLRADVNLKRAGDDGDVLCCCRTRYASGADKRRPRGNGRA